MKNLKIVFNIIKILGLLFTVWICLPFCFFISAILGIDIVIASSGKIDWQIVFYIFYLLIIILGAWTVPFGLFFIKNNKIRIITAIVYAVLFISYFFMRDFLPSVKRQYDIENCYDDGNYWDYSKNKCIKPD